MPEPLPIETGPQDPATEPGSGTAATRWLLAGATIALLAAGLLLWWRDGEAVFATYVVTALAWCF